MKKMLKLLGQLVLILLIYQAGCLISTVVEPFAVMPGSIMGMLLLVVLLSAGVVKLHMIEETCDFLLKYMGFFFVPLIVGLMGSFGLIRDSFLPLMAVFVISCLLVMVVSAKVTDMLILFRRERDE